MTNKLAILSSKDKQIIIQRVLEPSLDLNTVFKFSNIERVDFYDILRTWQYEDVSKILIDIDSAVEYGRINDLLLNLPRFQVIENASGSLRIWLMARNPVESYDRKFRKLIKKLGCEEIIVGDKLEQYQNQIKNVKAIDSQEAKQIHQQSKNNIHEEIAVNPPEDIAIAEFNEYGISYDDISIDKVAPIRGTRKQLLEKKLPNSLADFIDKNGKQNSLEINEKQKISDTKKIPTAREVEQKTSNALKKDRKLSPSSSKERVITFRKVQERNNDKKDQLQKKAIEQISSTPEVVDNSTIKEIESRAQNKLNDVVLNAQVGNGDNKQVLIVLPPEYVKPQVRISFAERMYWRIKSSIKNFIWTLITVIVMSGIATYLINSDFGSEVRTWIKSML